MSTAHSNSYGYNGALTAEVLKVIADHWPIVGGGMAEGNAWNLNKETFELFLVSRINDSKDSVVKHTLVAAGYMADNKVDVEALWTDFRTAKLFDMGPADNPTGMYGDTQDLFLRGQELNWIEFDNDGLLIPGSRQHMLAVDWAKQVEKEPSEYAREVLIKFQREAAEAGYPV
jgi:hypothetical protein